MEERDQTHVEQHGEGDVNIEVKPEEPQKDDEQQDDGGDDSQS